MTVNLALLVAVVFFVAKSPTAGQSSYQNAAIDTVATTTGPLDQLSSADIAVHVAFITGLPEAISVANHADTISAAEATSPTDNSVVAKPQVVAAALPSRKDIHTYVVQTGDTVSELATKFGVSSDSIKWSNGLNSNTIPEGKEIKLPPSGTNGIVYTVAAGDTPESLAQKYSADKDVLISFNDAEVKGFKPGELILIPDGVIRAPVVRAVATSAAYSGFAWGGSAPIYGSNGYDYGWCTWHAANRRAQIGRPVPSNLGNAISWYSVARNNGIPVGSTPADGAVLYDASMGGLGHVAFVEKVNEDGSIYVSDMNYPYWGRVTYRTIQPNEMGRYKFIY